MRMLDQLRGWARKTRRDSVTLWFACRHPGTPFAVKLLGFVVVAYALSPIDLIPDVIPVLGYLDEVMLLPALIWLAIRLLPEDILESCRLQADEWMATRSDQPRSHWGIAFVLLIWLAVAWAIWRVWVSPLF